jgi:serine/threonine protein phosphatase PrpC
MGDRDFKINLKEFLIISDPEIRYFQFKKNIDIAVLIACDGIWDVLTNQVPAYILS